MSLSPSLHCTHSFFLFCHFLQNDLLLFSIFYLAPLFFYFSDISLFLSFFSFTFLKPFFISLFSFLHHLLHIYLPIFGTIWNKKSEEDQRKQRRASTVQTQKLKHVHFILNTKSIFHKETTYHSSEIMWISELYLFTLEKNYIYSGEVYYCCCLKYLKVKQYFFFYPTVFG